jgi:transcription elongation GreA/GreB family factor
MSCGAALGPAHRPTAVTFANASVDKARLLRHLHALLQERVAVARAEIASTRGAFTSDTKSSAGDKHETGRAMVQQELDKLEEQHAKLIALQQELERVPVERVFDRVAFGSLVLTDQGTYFVSIGLGRIELDGGSCFAISLASPIGQALKDKRAGDAIILNGRSIAIHAVR